MTVEQLAKELDKIISPELSEPWDNDGRMIIPNPNKQVTRVLCALDCTTEAINAARVWGCNVIVTHHPLIFKPLENISPLDSVGKRVIKCISNDIAVLSYHTRLDIIEGGVNDTLCKALGITNTEAFIPYGRVGEVRETVLSSLIDRVCEGLQIDENELKIVAANSKVRRVAVVSGCGKDEIMSVIASGADTFITGEVMHNHMIDCAELGLNLICATHHATERIVLPVLSDMVKKAGATADIFMFKPHNEFGYPFVSSVINEIEEDD